jgi:hypothetical protein
VAPVISVRLREEWRAYTSLCDVRLTTAVLVLEGKAAPAPGKGIIGCSH